MDTNGLITESNHFVRFTQVWATISIGLLAAFLRFPPATSGTKCKTVFSILAGSLAASFFAAMLCMLLSARFHKVGAQNVQKTEKHVFCLSMLAGGSALIVAVVFMFILFIPSIESNEQDKAVMVEEQINGYFKFIFIIATSLFCILTFTALRLFSKAMIKNRQFMVNR